MSDVRENPFNKILNTFRDDSDERYVAPWLTGRINTVSPLTLVVNGQIVTNGIYVNSLLLGRASTINLTGLNGELTGTPESIVVSSGNLSGFTNLGGNLFIGFLRHTRLAYSVFPTIP